MLVVIAGQSARTLTPGREVPWVLVQVETLWKVCEGRGCPLGWAALSLGPFRGSQRISFSPDRSSWGKGIEG